MKALVISIAINLEGEGQSSSWSTVHRWSLAGWNSATLTRNDGGAVRSSAASAFPVPPRGDRSESTGNQVKVAWMGGAPACVGGLSKQSRVIRDSLPDDHPSCHSQVLGSGCARFRHMREPHRSLARVVRARLRFEGGVLSPRPLPNQS
jgi:hypothetical protein